MTPERWQEVKQVLAEVLELPPEERAEYLEERYAQDPTLREDLEPLVDSGDRAGADFLSEPVIAAAAREVDHAAMPWVGRRVGSYRVVESIGAGGMGEVFRAVRADDQYQKEVAIKVVRATHFGSAVIARFKVERQILAGLDHPNIARLLDGGTTDEGLPFLVMELIEGRPITEYCDVHDLPVRERLRLFLDVCSGVHYAHQHLVIHRDIKPQNILVTPGGVPKLLDFGIAKILEAGSDAASDSGATGFRALTPRYASPEQIMGSAMTTATDVYSLGVVLYELLTGIMPYDAATLSERELEQAICEREMQKPSQALRRAQHEPQTGPLRRTSVDKLCGQLSGDIDNIVQMAMRKEASRRYASVNDFQKDIRRHLDNLPVIARKDTFWYRANRFVARHSIAVAATCVVMLLLVAGFIVTIRAERTAKRRFDDVRALANSLIFDVHDSVKDLPGSTPARKIIVDRALRYLNVLEQESSGDLGLQRELATAYERVGAVQGDYLEYNLGDFEGTLSSYRKSLELRRQVDASSKDWQDRVDLARAYRLVAHQQWANGDPRGAREPIGRAIAVAQAIYADHPNDLKALYELGFDYEVSARIGYPGDPRAKEKMIDDYMHALALDESALKVAPDDVTWLHGYSTDLGNMANLLESKDPVEARKQYEKCLEIDRRLTQLSTDPRYQRSLAIDYGDIASIYVDVGEYQHAVENNLKDLAMYQQMVAADPTNALLRQGIAITYLNTADSCSRAGKLAMALDYSNRGLEIMRPLVTSSPQNAYRRGVYATMLVYRGTILTEAKQPEAARAAIEQARSIYEALFKAGNMSEVNAAAAGVKLAEALASGGHGRDAESEFRHALEIVEPEISADNPDLDALYAAADAYSGLGDLSAKAARQHGLTKDQRRAAWAQANSWYEKSQNTWRRIEHPNHSAPNSFQAGDPLVVSRELKSAEAALASLH